MRIAIVWNLLNAFGQRSGSDEVRMHGVGIETSAEVAYVLPRLPPNRVQNRAPEGIFATLIAQSRPLQQLQLLYARWPLLHKTMSKMNDRVQSMDVIDPVTIDSVLPLQLPLTI